MGKIKAWIQDIKTWYNSLTASIKEGQIEYSLSDTQFFWITTVWLVLFPFVTHAVFWLDRASAGKYLVFVGLEIAVLSFKFAKYINVSHGGTTIKLEGKEEQKNEQIIICE